MTPGRRKRGSALIESALATTVFLILIAGIMEFGILGFANNSISFAAQRAARFAAVRGSASGHPASEADIRAEALANIAALDHAALNVSVVWSPDNRPGGTVTVTVTYVVQPALLPYSGAALTLKGASRLLVTQ
jgi:Flp pilus assembly protein TadG